MKLWYIHPNKPTSGVVVVFFVQQLFDRVFLFFRSIFLGELFSIQFFFFLEWHYVSLMFLCNFYFFISFCFFLGGGVWRKGLGLFNKHLEHHLGQLYKVSFGTHRGAPWEIHRERERKVIYAIIDWRIERTGVGLKKNKKNKKTKRKRKGGGGGIGWAW